MKLSRRKVAAIVIISELAKKKKKKRSVWVREWILRRESDGAYNNLLSELILEDPMQFYNFMRMKPSDFKYLAEKIAPFIIKQNTKFITAICVRERLAVTLRFLASGDSYVSLSYLFRIAKCTISLIVPEVCNAIISVLMDDYMKTPSTLEGWQKVSEKFEKKWNFPKCLGAIDGKHIVNQAPQNSGSYFFNYKGQHSTVLMAVVDTEYKFLITTVGSNGRVSDGGVFRATGVSNYAESASNILGKTCLPGRMLRIPYVFVADDAFPLQPHIMKPYPFNSQGSLRIYNYRLSRARRIVENAFGLMSSMFRVLRKPILLSPKRVDSVVLAICCLHNYLLSQKSSTAVLYATEGTFDRESPETGEIIPGTWQRKEAPTDSFQPMSQQASNNYSLEAKQIRDEFRKYFVSPQGEISWQYKLM